MIGSILLLALSTSGNPLVPTVKKPENPSVGSVTSSNASGGVTAGVIGSVQQTNVLPSLVRGPLLTAFKERYTKGASLYRKLRTFDQTDDQIDKNCAELEQWYNATFDWLAKSVSPWAAERFAFLTPSIVNWGLAGNHKPEIVAKRSNYLNAFGPVLQNLDQLMREPSIYPETPMPSAAPPR